MTPSANEQRAHAESTSEARVPRLSGSSAFRFVVTLGIVNLFADMTYEGGSSINGPFLGMLGASAATIGVISGIGEFLGYALRAVAGYISDKTGKYWLVTFLGYGINLFSVPALALAGNWPLAAGLVIAERVGRAIRKPSVEAMLSYTTGSLGKGWVYALNTALDQIGATLGPLLIAGALLLKGTHRTGYAILLVPTSLALAALVVAQRFFPQPSRLQAGPTTRPKGFTTAYWLYMLAGACMAAGLSFELISYHFAKTEVVPEEWIPVLFALAMATDAAASLTHSFRPRRTAMTKKAIGIWTAVAALAVLGLALLTIKPYDRPEYVEIGTSESAFLIPLEGDTANQASFQSVQFLKQKLVAAKRIRITHQWSQLGFWPASGEWIPDVKLIKVDRRPVTREWTQSSQTGTSAKNEAVAVESKDSVNFTIGISCTAYIPEELAPVFLYSYPAKSLAEMMDMEVRARIQQIVAEEAGKHDLDLVRSKKNDIMKAVREDVLPFFRNKGIEITTVAMVGGLSYDNPEIQKAIDEAAKSSQLKVSAEARREAQEVENKTVKLAAEGKAQALRLEAEARAQAALTQADANARIRQLNAAAEAQAIRTVADAKAHEVQKATESPTVYLQLKSLDMEIERWKRWDGKYPAYLVQFGAAANGPAGLWLQPPAVAGPPVSTANK